MIKTYHALLISLGLITLLGFIKSLFVTGLPLETMVVGGIVPITLGYFGKRVWQKHRSFNEITKGDSND